MIAIVVDDKPIQTEAGRCLLEVCLENDIYIPNLCHLKGLDPQPASCRLCFVEIEGYNAPVTACTTPVKDGMKVRTDTDTVRNLQRTALRFLLSVHDVDCKNCVANKKCSLQNLAKFLKVGLKPKELDHYLKEPAVDESHPFIRYYPNRCVLCGRCVRVCQARHHKPLIAYAGRGFKTVISFFGAQEAPEYTHGECTACVDVCPVGALTFKEKSQEATASG